MDTEKKEAGVPKWILDVIGYGVAVFLGVLLGTYVPDGIEINTPPITTIQYEAPEQRKELNQENILYWLNYFEVEHAENRTCPINPRMWLGL